MKVNNQIKLNETGSNQIVWTKCSKLLFFEPKSPARRTNLSNDLKKDLFVFTTINSKNKKYKLLGNEIYIYNDLFLTMDYYMIYRGYINKPSEKAAVRKYSHFNKDLYEDEVELLKKLNGINPKHFLKYFAKISCDEGYFLATELAEQSLYIFMKNNSNKNLDEIDLLKLVEQSCEGLNTLHQLNVVHSAIEPRNILISYPDVNGQRRAVLTNIGINKKGFSDNFESVSWTSFEAKQLIINNNENFKATEKGDIFSMGCVIYFVLTKGQYPFGYGIQRSFDRRAKLNTKGMNPTYADLIESMVNCNDSERPSIKEVLIHPTFWSSEKKVLFFTHIKNILFTKNFAIMKTENFEDIQKGVINELEKKAQQIIGGSDWLQRLCPDVQQYEKNKIKHKISKTTEVKELINFIRNKDQHWDELKEEILKKFGETPEFIDYFLGQNRFPSLLIHTYNAMKKLKIERNLNNYYVVE
jgi:serine/threonine-protein kinase/endoribonuclease IRE1